MHRFFIGPLVLLLVAVVGCAEVDTVYRNGKIYTIDAEQPWVEAVAISDGNFIRVGKNEDVDDLIGLWTNVIDLEGSMVLPGLHDIHIHPLKGAIKTLYECTYPYTLTPSEILKKVKQCAETDTGREWITGGAWKLDNFPEGGPHKSQLDQIIPDRPVALFDMSLHNAWLNSKALEIAGITAETPDPINGKIVRDAAGEPTGFLMETAASAIHGVIPSPTLWEVFSAGQWMNEMLNGYGVTSIKDAFVPEEALDVYRALGFVGELKLRVATSLNSMSQNNEDLAQLIDGREKYRTELLNPDFVKLLLDGVPFAKTAAMLADYSDDPGNRGTLFIDQEQLNQHLITFDKAGLTVKMHAAGDRAVRVALNAIEAARKANGVSGLRHEISHAGNVHPNDLPRFAELNVIAEVSPVLWHPTVAHATGHAAALGEERVSREYPIKSLIDAGALVVAGTDWPAAAPTANPWTAIESMVTRKHPLGEVPGVSGAGEAIDLATVLRIFTLNGSHAVKLEKMTGSIEEGKYADMIVLDQNIFEVSVDKISETQVLRTVLAGETVYQHSN